MTATAITEYEQTKEMYRKMGINIESEWAKQAWKETEPIRKALAMQEALKTKTVIEAELMKKAWKKVTPIPQEMNGHGYLYECVKCGYCTTYAGAEKEPPYKCPKCGK